MGDPLEFLMMTTFCAFNQLLAMDKSFCIHHQKIKKLLIEIYKAIHDIPGKSLKELFVKRESTISLRSKPELVILSVNTVLKVKKSLRCFGSVIWLQLKLEKIIRFHDL